MPQQISFTKIAREVKRPFQQMSVFAKRLRNRWRYKNRLAVWGWWQGHNLGDNWIRHVMSLNFPEAVCIDTSECHLSHFGFVICGGGGLFVKEVISPWDNPHIAFPYGFIGLGVEFEQTLNTAQKLKDNAEFFFVRDQESIDRMHLTGLERSYDVTFSKPLCFVEENKLDMNTVLFAWGDLPNLFSRPEFRDYIGNTSVPQDWMTQFAGQFQNIKFDDFQTKDHDIDSRFKNVGFIVSSKFHGIVAAIQKGIPFVAIDASPKIRDLCKDAGLEKYCVKYDQIHSIRNLIDEVKQNVRHIREKQKIYRDRAHIQIVNDIEIARKKISQFVTSSEN